MTSAVGRAGGRRPAKHRRARGRSGSSVRGSGNPRPTAELLGRLKVWELARLAGIGVEPLIRAVVRASGLPRLPWPTSGAGASKVSHPRPRGRSARGGGPRTIIAPAAHFEPPAEPPPLVELAPHVTLRELDAIVSHWVLAVVLHEHGWNVTRAAARLRTSRRALREHWGRVRDSRVERVSEGQGRAIELPPSSPPTPSIRDLLAGGAGLSEIRDITQRWFVAVTIARTRGNRTHAAEALDTSRRAVRRLLGPRPPRENAMEHA